MGAHGWRKSASVEAWLFAEGHAFDFYQAVALLERLRPGSLPVGEGEDPREEAVRFSSSVALAFPETDVARVDPPRTEDDPARMVVHFLGLAGALGPVPPPFAELIYQRAARGDAAGRDFLDIFNHRLVSFAYRIRRLHRIGLGVTSPEEDAAARHLFSLLGLGAGELRGRLAVPDRALLYHAGNLGHENRSMEGLVRLLGHHFGARIEALPLSGAFQPIEPEDRTALGRSGRNRELGRGAGLGGRFWDQEATFELRLGPMKFDAFRRFLPHEDALAPLCALIQLYVGQRFHFGLILVLAAGEAPPLEIGKAGAARLGQSAWIGRSKRGPDGTLQVRLSRAAIRAALREGPRPSAERESPAEPPAPPPERQRGQGKA
jgi:type VI secretion system protein ImpH